MNFEKQISRLKSDGRYADIAELARLEDELNETREKAGIAEKRSRLFRAVDRLLEKEGKEISKKKYITLLLSCGWFTGAHRFYSGKKISGLLYLLFCWTGIPFAMCLFDLMMIIPLENDENGLVTV